MKIGRTNAIAISGGGGTTQSPYDEWQEGFNANWDSVVANAPMTNTNTQRILHIYTKVELLKMNSAFPTSVEIYTYNGSVYRQITMDENKRLAFIEADYITNTSDGFDYLCVIYGTDGGWGSSYFNVYLPVVYSNSKSCNLGLGDSLVNLINSTQNFYPYLRGVDINTLSSPTIIRQGLQHLSVINYQSGIITTRLYACGDAEIAIFKQIIDNTPIGTTYNPIMNAANNVSNAELADWLYNDFVFKYFNAAVYNISNENYVKRFVINSNLLISANGYVSGLPEFQYLEGTITENQTSATNIGYHGFRGSGTKFQQQKNFPLWTVLEGATTGCLRPLQVANTSGSFLFSSLQLERSNFALFNAGVIDTDPTKSFVANLPILPTDINGDVIVPQSITFQDKTFYLQFTEDEQDAIEDLVVNQKKWTLAWKP